MIRRLTVRNFKRFTQHVFDLPGSVVLAGPNNSGKTTLLQAVATWRFGLDRWVTLRSGTKAKFRTGVPLTRADFTAVPLREMNLLWNGRRLARGTGPDRQCLIEIVAEGGSGKRQWTCGLEFQYANPEMVYVRPLNAKQLGRDEIAEFPPPGARELDVVHVPPLCGIERDEPRRDPGMQDLLIGQGRPGEILRNLLWEVS